METFHKAFDYIPLSSLTKTKHHQQQQNIQKEIPFFNVAPPPVPILLSATVTANDGETLCPMFHGSFAPKLFTETAALKFQSLLLLSNTITWTRELDLLQSFGEHTIEICNAFANTKYFSTQIRRISFRPDQRQVLELVKNLKYLEEIVLQVVWIQEAHRAAIELHPHAKKNTFKGVTICGSGWNETGGLPFEKMLPSEHFGGGIVKSMKVENMDLPNDDFSNVFFYDSATNIGGVFGVTAAVRCEAYHSLTSLTLNNIREFSGIKDQTQQQQQGSHLFSPAKHEAFPFQRLCHSLKHSLLHLDIATMPHLTKIGAISALRKLRTLKLSLQDSDSGPNTECAKEFKIWREFPDLYFLDITLPFLVPDEDAFTNLSCPSLSTLIVRGTCCVNHPQLVDLHLKNNGNNALRNISGQRRRNQVAGTRFLPLTHSNQDVTANTLLKNGASAVTKLHLDAVPLTPRIMSTIASTLYGLEDITFTNCNLERLPKMEPEDGVRERNARLLRQQNNTNNTDAAANDDDSNFDESSWWYSPWNEMADTLTSFTFDNSLAKMEIGNEEKQYTPYSPNTPKKNEDDSNSNDDLNNRKVRRILPDGSDELMERDRVFHLIFSLCLAPAECSNLETLRLYCVNINDTILEQIVQRFTKLRILDLRDCGFEMVDFEYLTKLPNLRKLIFSEQYAQSIMGIIELLKSVNSELEVTW